MTEIECRGREIESEVEIEGDYMVGKRIRRGPASRRAFLSYSPRLFSYFRQASLYYCNLSYCNKKMENWLIYKNIFLFFMLSRLSLCPGDEKEDKK